jgi:hypothetical protein
MPLLSRPEHIVYFFRDLHDQYPITPQVLAKRTAEYRGWVEAYVRNHKIPLLRAEKDVSKEKCVFPHLERMEGRNQLDVYGLRDLRGVYEIVGFSRKGSCRLQRDRGRRFPGGAGRPAP